MTKFSEFFDLQETSFDESKEMFIKNMDMLKSMDVATQTLYKKWKEIKKYYTNKTDISRIVKAKIWVPTNIMDKEQTLNEIKLIQPRIRYVVPKTEDDVDWIMLRVFSHTMVFDQNPGRFLKFLIYDDLSGKYLGAASLGSDVITITCRDEWIGWSKDNKLNGKLNNSAIATCIMSTQPFGYNFLGGKLVASLLTTKIVSEVWKEMYDDVLVGLTTTSLYGSESMYNSIPFWKKVGSSKGNISIKPDDDVYEVWHHWIKQNMSDEYSKKILYKSTDNGPVTGVKQRILDMIFKSVGVSASKYKHGFERGVYYAPLYENTREFLRGEISSDELVPLTKLKDDVHSILDWWRPKAMSRYIKLYEESRIKPEILYYNSLIDMDWEEVKKKYLADVGR